MRPGTGPASDQPKEDQLGEKSLVLWKPGFGLYGPTENLRFNDGLVITWDLEERSVRFAQLDLRQAIDCFTEARIRMFAYYLGVQIRRVPVFRRNLQRAIVADGAGGNGDGLAPAMAAHAFDHLRPQVFMIHVFGRLTGNPAFLMYPPLNPDSHGRLIFIHVDCFRLQDAGALIGRLKNVFGVRNRIADEYQLRSLDVQRSHLPQYLLSPCASLRVAS